jgi:HPt (histidine-containing phosphotransfer) domain-containing protein
LLEEQFAVMRDQFCVRIRADRDALRQARDRGDWTPESTWIVHKLAGSAGMLGFLELSEAAHSLEDALALSEGDIPVLLQALFAEIDNAIARSAG